MYHSEHHHGKIGKNEGATNLVNGARRLVYHSEHHHGKIGKEL